MCTQHAEVADSWRIRRWPKLVGSARQLHGWTKVAAVQLEAPPLAAMLGA